MEKKKNSNKIMLGAAILVAVVFMGLGVTYARYTTSTSGTSSARVAKFAFDLNGAHASVQAQSLNIDDLFNYTYNNGSVVGASNAKVVAPGTSGYIEVLLQNQGEVVLIPDWTITETNASNVPLQYQISSSTTPVAANWSSAGSLTATENTVAIGGQQKYYLHWRWNPSSTDAADTALGVSGTATVSIRVDCIVSQYIPD